MRIGRLKNILIRHDKRLAAVANSAMASVGHFVLEYQQLLASTGEGKAADLAERFGMDIRQSQFWEDSLAVIARRIDRYCELR
jgi:oligoendopeptidase F